MNVDTNHVIVVLIMSLVEYASFLGRGSREVCVIDSWVYCVSNSPDDGILRSLDGAEVL